MDSIDPAIQSYLGDLQSESELSSESIHWGRLLAQFRKSDVFQRLTESDLQEILATLDQTPGLGFLFKQLPPGDQSFANNFRSKIIRVASRVLLYNRLRIGHPDLGQMLSTKSSWEHFFSTHFLQRLGIYDEYLEFMASFRINSDMSTARHFYYATQIRLLAEKTLGSDPLDIVEIGAGAGNLACFLHRLNLVRSYCIVDLPEMLVLSAYQISKYVPDAEIVFAKPGTDYSPIPGRFLFVQARDVNRVPDNSVNAAINIFSFMEMDESTRDDYIEEIYRVAKPDSLFVNVNRRQRGLPQHDGSIFDNNPIRYPYDPKDKVLLWEECPFHENAREAFRTRISLGVMRAALINVPE